MRDEERAAVRRRGQHQEGGASLVEFALVVPLLALFLFGIVEFGVAYDKKQSINSAAREGARMAAIPDDANVYYDTIKARVDATFVAFGSNAADDVDVQVVDGSTGALLASYKGVNSESPCTDHPGEAVVVTVTEGHVVTIPFFGTRNVSLVGKGEFRCEIDG